MHHRPLQHALETQRRLGFHLVHQMLGHGGGVFNNAAGQLLAQKGKVHAHAIENFGHVIAALHQRQQQMLHPDKFLLLRTGAGVSVLQYFFQLRGNHRNLLCVQMRGVAADLKCMVFQAAFKACQ